MRFMLLIAVLLLLFALVLSGCPREQPAEMQGRQEVVGEGQNVEVALGEWYVRLDPESVQPGNVTFDIRNEGTITHAFEVEGQGIEERSENLSPGQTTQMTVNLPAGTYEAYCPIGNHAERGMRTELVVEE